MQVRTGSSEGYLVIVVKVGVSPAGNRAQAARSLGLAYHQYRYLLGKYQA